MDLETRSPAGSNLEGLAEATELLRRTHLRLEGLADRLCRLRERLASPTGSGPGGATADAVCGQGEGGGGADRASGVASSEQG